MAGPLKEVDVDQYGSQQKTSSTEVVHLVTPIGLVWRREAPIDSSTLIAANSTKGAIEADPTSSSIPLEGEWVKFDTTTGEATGCDAGDWGYLVWAGRYRLDVPGSTGVTVLVGTYMAETTAFATDTDAAGFGDPLYVDSNGVLTKTDPGSGKVVALFDGTVDRNGETYIRFISVVADT